MMKVTKGAFSVIGKLGSTSDGEGFIQRLWAEADAHFAGVSQLAKRDADGKLAGLWGAMSDFSHAYRPWEDNFSRGLYLAGVECVDNAEAPDGWTKWTLPAYEYIAVEARDGAFEATLRKMREAGIPLAGAVQDYTDPATGKCYMYFPVRALE